MRDAMVRMHSSIVRYTECKRHCSVRLFGRYVSTGPHTLCVFHLLRSLRFLDQIASNNTHTWALFKSIHCALAVALLYLLVCNIFSVKSKKNGKQCKKNGCKWMKKAGKCVAQTGK